MCAVSRLVFVAPPSLEELERMAEEKTTSAESTPPLSRSPIPAKPELAEPPSPDFDSMEEMYLLEVGWRPSNHCSSPHSTDTFLPT